jgi:hypothetical protein
MEWIGRVCMRTMLRGRPQRRENCDLLNQGAGYSSHPSANLIQSDAWRSTFFQMISMPCGLW